MRIRLCACLAVVAAAGLGSRCALAVDPMHHVTDVRRCTASYAGNGNGSTWNDRPVAFAPFDGGANLDVTNGLETWSSHCTQVSEMNDATMAFVGGGDATILAAPLSGPLTAQGQSKFDQYFTIATATDYALVGNVAEFGHPDSISVVRLSLVGGPVIEEIISSPDSNRTFDRSGQLQPGSYRLYAEATGKARTVPLQLIATGAAGCTMQFMTRQTRQCPSDWNTDGILNTHDLFDFLSDFMSLRADYNMDGMTDSEDLFLFIMDFGSGC